MEKRRSFLQACVILLAIAAFALVAEAKKKRRRTQERRTEPTLWTYSVTAEYPHDSQAFTQGILQVQTGGSSATAFDSIAGCMTRVVLPRTGLQFDRVCDDGSKVCHDVFWESTGEKSTTKVRRAEGVAHGWTQRLDTGCKPDHLVTVLFCNMRGGNRAALRGRGADADPISYPSGCNTCVPLVTCLAHA